MVRRFLDQPVEPAAIDRIAHAGTSAPSAGNTRGQRLVVVTDPDVRSDIAEAAGEPSYLERGFPPWLSSAPVLIVLGTSETAYRHRYAEPDKAESSVSRTDGDWPVPWWWVDAGATLMAVLLAAEDEGLAAGFLGGHACPDVGTIVSFDEGIHLVGVVTIGHPAEDRRSSSLDRMRPEQVRWVR